MKKLKIVLLMLIFLVGCTNKTEKNDLLMKKYEAAYSDLVSNDKFASSSSFYDIETVVNSYENDKFRIDTIIDNPKVAMYNVIVIAEINSIGVKQYEEVLPSLGIVDQSIYNLIPFQVNQDEGFYAGLVVSGISERAKGEVIVEIAWTNYAETKSYQEFLKLPYGEQIEEETEDLPEAESESDGE